MTTVNKDDIRQALEKLRLEPQDTVIVHSSLKSFGQVNGGASAVIDALKETVCEGTVCFPALRSQNFSEAYETWDIQKTPSDVGLISETFRKSSGVLRSDQATHSVTAFGKQAAYITSDHSTGKPRHGIFGNTPFSYSSPWQKIYELDGKVLLLGVTMVYNTFKHFVEYSMVDDVVSALSGATQQAAIAELSSWSDMQAFHSEREEDKPNGVWFWHDGLLAQKKMEEHGLLQHAICGKCQLTAFRVKDYYALQYTEFVTHPEQWFSPAAVQWLKTYRK